MNPQFRDIVQNTLTSYIAPRTRTDGGFAGDTPPPSLDVFMSRLREEVVSFHANSWELDSLDQANLLEQASNLYSVALGNWISKPLAGDAPADVVAWQKNARG